MDFKLRRWNGDGHPTYIIAEIGVNHNGMVPLAFELIDNAIDAGVDAVKFQKRNLKNLYPKKMLENVNTGEKNMAYLLPILQQVELSDEDYFRIKEYCDQKGVTFICSPFDMDSADFLEELGVPAFKVASADMINLPLLSHLVKKGKPMILSTGGISPWTARWMGQTMLPAWNRTALRKWCAISGRSRWLWVQGRKSICRAGKSSTGKCWQKAWSLHAISKKVR
ncbi:MAG: N-acetylneuraminate synthase family protein [Anaerolineales bacterium]